MNRLQILYSRENGDFEILDTADNNRWLGAARSYSEAEDVRLLLAPSYPNIPTCCGGQGCAACGYTPYASVVVGSRVHDFGPDSDIPF